jgi:uncharacterized protein DUF2855
MIEFQVNKSNFTQTRTVDDSTINASTPLSNNEVIVQIESFALTANNITYAVMGEKLKYWQFFPASDNEENQWGIIPVWGFACVVASKNKDVPVGEKLFGYFPPSSFLKMTPTHINNLRFIDGSEHRANLPPAYNLYRRVSAEQGYDSRFDNQRMLLFPLHITSYCLWDYIKDNEWFKAEQIIIISASSKTSIGLAFGLHEDCSAPRTIGMTSKGNRSFVQNIDLYDDVIEYGDLSKLDVNAKTLIVDMAGNAEQLKELESQLGDNLKYCIQVGLTHWDNAQATSPFNHAPSEMFFAPGQIQKRIGEWGVDAFEQASISYMTKAAVNCSNWLEFIHVDGLQHMGDYYSKVCNGQMPPEQGVIVKP